jgi:regulator of protease activity HflC (stomatin/prohibitin superfamily)
MLTGFTLLALVALFVVYNTVTIVSMRHHYVVERLGKFRVVLEPGLHFLIPFFDHVRYRHELREQVFDIPSQTCITQDNMQVEVDGLIYLKVTDAKKATYGIGDYRNAAINLAQTTMRSEVGKLTLGHAFSERGELNNRIVKEIDRASEAWGVKVLRYELKNIRPSKHIVHTLEKQMEAEREKRAEITLATADKESRIRLSEGEKIEAINISEGEKQKRINLAKGRASEIELLAAATANGIRTVASAINEPGGSEAVKMQLLEQFIDEVGHVMKTAKVSFLPSEMANIKAAFEGFDRVTNPIASPSTDKKR